MIDEHKTIFHQLNRKQSEIIFFAQNTQKERGDI